MFELSFLWSKTRASFIYATTVSTRTICEEKTKEPRKLGWLVRKKRGKKENNRQERGRGIKTWITAVILQGYLRLQEPQVISPGCMSSIVIWTVPSIKPPIQSDQNEKKLLKKCNMRRYKHCKNQSIHQTQERMSGRPYFADRHRRCSSQNRNRDLENEKWEYK